MTELRQDSTGISSSVAMPSPKARTTLCQGDSVIRAVEQRLLHLFSQGKLFGTVHTCIGQESSAWPSPNI